MAEECVHIHTLASTGSGHPFSVILRNQNAKADKKTKVENESKPKKRQNGYLLFFQEMRAEVCAELEADLEVGIEALKAPPPPLNDSGRIRKV